VDLHTGARAGVEALARFTVPPHRGPALWFSEAWELGLGIELDLVVARVALSRLVRVPTGAYLSLNLSPVTLVSPEFRSILSEIDARRLVVEVTETAPIEDIRGVDACLRALRAEGGRLAVDDAGAGYSGLQRILRLGPEFIKLDMLITRDVDRDPARRALARALVSFSDEVGAVLVAEGIESAAEAGVLRDLGVRYGQGYYLGRPGPLVEETGEVATGEDTAS
jgi:EAL domain-containing protein (putative c-di-GMP-specific phosphodiesterase class I)